MQKILVPTDFSDNAMKAALYAAEIARKAKATLYLLHVIEPIDDKVHQPFPLHEKYLEEAATMRMEDLKIIQKTISKGYPNIKIETELAKASVVRGIADFAETEKIDLIVMGTKGASGLKEVFVGSVTTGIIRHTKLPVLAIPDEYIVEEPDGIMFATNHFEENKDVLEIIVELAGLFSATIHVAVFVEKDKIDAIGYMDDTRQLDHYLNYLKKAFPGIACKGELLEGKDFEETVQEYDEKNKLDIISMITYPKGFWDKLLKRSATKKMAFHSRMPVLAIPASSHESEA